MSGPAVIAVDGLPAMPLDASAAFYRLYLDVARAALREADALALAFPAAGHEHDAWRLAVVQELAREAAPGRVNGIVGDDPEKAQELADWLTSQPGITGQILVVDGKTGEMD